MAFRNGSAMLAVAFICGTGCVSAMQGTVLAPDPMLTYREFSGDLDSSVTYIARLVSTPGDHEYGIHSVRYVNEDKLILTKLIDRDVNDVPRYRILSAMSISALPKGKVIVIGDCTLNGVQDVDIIALVQRQGKPALSRVERAWRASGVEGSIVEIGIRGISCEYDRFLNGE